MPDPVYVRARRALLDALQALGPHREAVILVGAQAVYLHVGEAQEALSSFTIDADLALNPTNLPDEPALEATLREAGFRRKEQPGLWFTPDDVEVDLLVPASLAGVGRRGVDLGPHHDRTAAMRAAGLEAALVDNAPRRITALDPDDRRSFVLPVAGPAALLIAKLHKIGE
ncbi:MAG: GSU2403 family nucleotidyltransferase fold protein [Dehalococcoidia bacterium]